MHEIYALKDLLCKQLEEYGRKGELTAAILERVDTLAHAVKNLDKIIETYELEDGEGHSMATGYDSRRKDSMGRYSTRRSMRNSYDGSMENMVDSIRGMMKSLPQEVQRDAQRIVQKLEDQM